MRSGFRFRNWPLRKKMAVLLLVTSVIPLTIATVIEIRSARDSLLEQTGNLLAARADQLVGQMDTLNRGYQRSISTLTSHPAIFGVLTDGNPETLRIEKTELQAILNIWLAGDENIRAIAVLDASGNVKLATHDELLGRNLAYQATIGHALQGAAVISSIQVPDAALGPGAAVAYLDPIRDQTGQTVGLTAVWVRASALWDVMKASNGLAGPGSFAVLFDEQGIRIGHTYSDDIVFHPGGSLPIATIDALVSEHRFGPQTRELLTDVRAFPEQFERSLAAAPDRALFRGFAPVNGKWNYGVGRRFSSVLWTVFYMVPEDDLLAQITAMTRARILFGTAIAILALICGALFSLTILRPVQSLARSTAALTAGDLSARVPVLGDDELGKLGTSLNAMAERIDTQTQALNQARDDLESRVLARTAAFQAATQSLEDEVGIRKAAEETLRASQQLLRGIVESSDDAIVSKSLEGIITSWNPGAERLFGFAADEAVGKPMLIVVPPENIAEEVDILARIGRGETIENFETVRVTKDAKRVDISASISPLKDKAGQVIGASTIARDITERKKADERLHAHLQRMDLLQQITHAIGERQDLGSIFQVVLQNLEDHLAIDFGCIAFYESPDSYVTVTAIGPRSRAVGATLQFSETTVIPLDDNGLSRCVQGDLVHEPNLREVAARFPEQLVAAGLASLVASPLRVESNVFGVLIASRHRENSFSSGECEFLRQLSEHVALAAHQSRLYSALERAYEDLRKTQQAVMRQERLRMLGQMASGIAHDINNAISPISVYVESLLERETTLSVRGREYLQVIQQSTADVSQTVARMTEFYRERESDAALAPLQLNELIQQVMDRTRSRWSNPSLEPGEMIRVTTELSAGLPAVMGSENEIRDALTNLVLNAVDAMPDGGDITLTTSLQTIAPDQLGASETTRVTLEVSDTGTGMDEKTRERCLEPFFTTKGERGTGLGLAMVFGTMQRHGAEIEIKSALGKGTTFRLTFPALATNPVALVASTGTHLALFRQRILIVDDDLILLQSLRSILEGDGHVVEVASGGQLGIDAFQTALGTVRGYSLVITDLGMPYVDGRKVAASVKALSPTTPVIMLTGWGKRLLVERSTPAHVDCVLSKPPKLRDLRIALAECCVQT